ncbi:unnamed protein product [Mytilus edulis]|uniref:Uncharacterized protein n=1 Tax=Mytilus edulis TaxID=6550 RepID=A0A8S3UYD5_MYTED|nr:unnamed protein product [Mytilus edulis]
MGQHRQIDVTYEEHARLKYRRVRALEQYKIIGWVLLNCSILSITVGIVIAVVGRDVDSFPISTGSPVWSGLAVLVVCVFAFIVGCYNPHFFDEGDSNKLFSWLLTYYISAIIAIILCLISLGFTIHGAVKCGTWKYEKDQTLLKCGYNYDVQIVMHVTASLLGIFEIIFLIYGIIIYYVYKEVYRFYEWEISYYDDYLYTVPRGEHRFVENSRFIENSRYLTTTDKTPVSEHYVTAEKPRFDVVEGSTYSTNSEKPASVVSEYTTSNHKYLVLRMDRNQIRPL